MKITVLDAEDPAPYWLVSSRSPERMIAAIDAARALALGIVNRVVPAADLETETMTLAKQLAAAAPLALRGMLDCVNIGGECGIEEGLEYESAQFGLIFSTEDMREGTKAFLERRKPNFSGR